MTIWIKSPHDVYVNADTINIITPDDDGTVLVWSNGHPVTFNSAQEVYDKITEQQNRSTT